MRIAHGRQGPLRLGIERRGVEKGTTARGDNAAAIEG